MNKHTSPKVTVIIPVYNTEKQLRECLTSVCDQTYQNLEIILVDDGSTDASGQICDEAAKQDERIQVVHKQNGGVSSARNCGLDQATGNYVAFVDSDDKIAPETIEVLVEAAERNKVGLAVCDYVRTGEPNRESKCSDKELLLTSNQVLTHYLTEDENIRIPHSVWGKLYERKLIGEKRFPLIKRTEELLFSTEIFCEADNCVYIPRKLYFYQDERQDSLMHEADPQHTVEHEIPLLKEQVEKISQSGFAEEGNIAAFYFGKRLMYFYIGFRDKGLSKEAKKTKQYAKENKNMILTATKGPLVKKTDRIRIAMFVHCPALYYRFVMLHDRRRK